MERTIVKGQEERDGVIFRLREDGKTLFKTLPFHNYFFIKEEDYEIVEFIIKDFIKSTEIIDANNGIYRKLILKNNYSRNKLRNIIEENGCETFESDFNSIKRFLVNEYKIPLNQKKLKCCFLDIETDDRQPLDKDYNEIVSGNSAITSCAFKDLNTGDVKFIYNKARDHITLEEAEANPTKFTSLLEKYEPEFLVELKNIAREYDVLFAWNGRFFDFPFIKDRFAKYGMNYDELFMVDIDYKLIYFQFTWANLKKTNLNFVSEYELSTELEKENTKFKDLSEIQKIDWREKTGLRKFYQLYLKEFELFKEYNIQDVNLMFMLEQKLNYFNLCNVISKETHTFLQDAIYNSRTFDNAMCIEYKKRNLIAPSRPNEQEYQRRLLEKPGGGYTYVYKKGLWKKLYCRDFKSFYPTSVVTYNISPENFIKEIQPDLKSVFSEREIEYIYYCKNAVKNFKDAKGGLKKLKYEKDIESKREEMNLTAGEKDSTHLTFSKIKQIPPMEELMFKFIEKYDQTIPEFTQYLKENNYTATPADINYNTYGWDVHPHRLFKNTEEAVFPTLSRKFLLKRDEVKYKMKDYEYHSPEWWEHEMYQLGLKTLGNSGYGAFGFKNFRFYMLSISDSITTTARFAMKKSILFAKKQGCDITHGDTDSAYLKIPKELDVKKLDILFYNYYDKMVMPYNCVNKIELTNPETEEKEIKNHFIVFENEKMFNSCIVVAKKRYYYKQQKGDNYTYDCVGGYFKKSNAQKLAADIQYELCKNILDFDFNKELWRQKILDLKKKIYSFKLEEEHIVTAQTISRDLKDYGKPMMDSKTGQQKMTAAGKPRFASVPVHIKLAKRLKEQGQEFQTGDKISYIITASGPLEAISVEEFRENPGYDSDYYFERVISPLIEILSATCPEDVYTTFRDCWPFTERQIKKLINDLEEDK